MLYGVNVIPIKYLLFIIYFIVIVISVERSIVSCDIYFPKMYSSGRYVAKNYGEYQWEHEAHSEDGSLVKWYIISQAKLLLAEIVNGNFSLAGLNCYLLIYDWSHLGNSCKLGEENTWLDGQRSIILLKCNLNQKSVILLSTLSIKNATCVNVSTKELEKKHLSNLSYPGRIVILAQFSKNSLPISVTQSTMVLRLVSKSYNPFSVVVWLPDSIFYLILSLYTNNSTYAISDWKIINHTGNPTKQPSVDNHNSTFAGLLSSITPPRDIIAKENTLIGVFERGCLKYCNIYNCIKLTSVYLDNCNSNQNGGLLLTPTNGNIVIRQTHFTSVALFGKTNSLSYNIDFDIFCHMKYDLNKNKVNSTQSHNVFDAWAKCGNFTVENVVMEIYMINRDPSTYKPCKLSNDGNMLACLIFGEPYIFDIGDRQSAHPISSFDVSSWTLGSSIIKYGFSSPSSFYFELYKNENDNNLLEDVVEGFVFNIQRFLQPSLMSSQVIYPTLATSITPSESYILVNHLNLDVWLFTHAGRIFYRNGSSDGFKINLTYRDDISFFISDYLQEISNNTLHRSLLYYGHNYEHPFAFFSPDKTRIVYLSHFRVLSGSFSASAITIVDLYGPGGNGDSSTQPEIKRSIIHIGDQPLLTQAGISYDNEYLYVIKQRNLENYLSLCIFEVTNMPAIAFNMSSMKASIEISGVWSWNQYDSTESSKIWVIGAFVKDQLVLSIHFPHNISTHIKEYKILNDFSVTPVRTIKLDKCIAVSNFNDYITNKLVVLCSQSLLSVKFNQTYRIVMVDYPSGEIYCSLQIEYKFSPLNVEFDSLKSTNIPGFDFDPTNHRLVITCEHTVHVYFTKRCPFQLLFTFMNHHIISSAATLNIINQKLTYGITLLSYLQKIDIISDCTNGFGIASSEGNTGFYCTRCKPGYYGLGCIPCPAGFVCNGYAQLQPSSPCPEGFFCLEATGSNEIVILESASTNRKNNTDIVYNFLKMPHKCPSGAYCPAGTAQPYINDTINNSPQSCIEGFYCPEGSVKPTQKSCPIHATSPLRSKSFLDCFCQEGYFGIAINDFFCIKCLKNGICARSSNFSTGIISYMTVPEGYWPNHPGNVSDLLKCQNTTPESRTPCYASTCALNCENLTVKDMLQFEKSFNCSIQCTAKCAVGHEGRLCSKCLYGYYKHSHGQCTKCDFIKKDTIYLLLPITSMIAVIIFIILRKLRYRSVVEKPSFLVSDDSLLELLLTIIMLTFGFTTASTLLLLLFFMTVTYLENLDTPQYAKYIFIFYIQTLQALVGDHFKWPNFFGVLVKFFNAFYATVPGISCLTNPFNGNYVGWVGGVMASIYAPIIVGLLLLLLSLTGSNTLWEALRMKKMLSFYCFTLFILQFPLSGLSLNTLACSYDKVSAQWYMKSQPWQNCSLGNTVQISGFVGVCAYFFGYPLALNYLYWSKFFDRCIHKELEGLIIPSGTKCDMMFISFILLRGMILVVILILVPAEWDIKRLLIISMFIINIIMVIKRKPYLTTSNEAIRSKYLQNDSCKNFNSKTKTNFYVKCILLLKKSHEGEFLELASLILISFSYLLMDTRNANVVGLSTRSFIVGSLNFVFTIYFVFFVLIEHRIGLFHYIAYAITSIYSGCCYCIHKIENNNK